jgi:hypothetical protein
MTMNCKKVFSLVFIIPLFLFLNSCSSGDKNTDIKKDSIKNTVEQPVYDTIAKSQEINQTQSEKRELNKYFSYFSEVFMEPFEPDALSDKSMIRFSVFHNYRNNERIFERSKDGMKAKIKESIVDETAIKFFNKKIIKHQKLEGIEYSKGYYLIDEAGGEAYVFSQVEKFTDNGNGIYTALLNVYTANSGWTDDPNGNVQEWKKSANGDEIPELTGQMEATIKKVTEDGKSRYILLSYKNVK